MKTKPIMTVLRRFDHTGKAMSRAELARKCGISPAMMNNCISYLPDGRDFRIQVDDTGEPIAMVERMPTWRVVGGK